MTEPRTAAGRALLDLIENPLSPDWAPFASTLDGILAIEAEAAELAGGLDPRLEAAFDHLGGMWSWHENPAEPQSYLYTGNGWYLDAGRLLRAIVGRPAHVPTEEEVALARACRHPVVIPPGQDETPRTGEHST